ncbi:MAG: hypothetical protein LBS30_03545 [Planctomycetota bacterium]|nr:hypothetical protein [Planctomycetota bacterium]
MRIAALLFAATAAAASEMPLAGADGFRANPALPNPNDLVIFDDASPVEPAAPDALGANQGAFPVYYGAIPPAIGDLAAADEPDAAAPVPAPIAAATRSAPDADIAPAAPPSSPISPEPLPELRPDPAPPSETAAARLPDPSPQPQLQPPGAAPEAAAAPGDTVALTEFKNDQALDGTPLPPPPLPELVSNTADAANAITAAPPGRPGMIDINRVRADFNSLKAFCDADSLGSAAEIYARMPDFGANEEANRLRADAANLLVLGLSRADNLSAARRIYESVPVDMAGDDATLAKARSIVNMATYYVRAERYSDAYDILMDIGKIRNRSALNAELFRLMARMIPYLDNADQTDKAASVYDLLLGEVNSPGTAALFAENVPGVFKYYLHYVDKSESPRNRRKRLDFLEHAFAGMGRFAGDPDIRLARKNLGESLAARYAGDPERAARFYVED